MTTIDNNQLNNAINQSGFPFELEIAKTFSDLGFEINLSHLLFDKNRNKDVEIDLMARKREVFDTKSGNKLLLITNIIIECKDNSLPYVCFGMEHKSKDNPGYLDNDLAYCHILTSRDDGMRNRFSLVAFSGEGIKAKKHHHQFNRSKRFYSIATLERKGKENSSYYKVNIPDNFKFSLYKLGLAISDNYNSLSGLLSSKRRYLEEIEEMPVIITFFSALIHSGKHYQFSIEDKQALENSHTSVFLNGTYGDSSLDYIVDLINKDEIPDAVSKILNSSEYLLKAISPYFANA